MAHCTLKAGTVSKEVRHKTVSEFWYVISGTGAIWRSSDKETMITQLESGVTIEISLGTSFQYSSYDTDLVFICVTMPPRSGHDEASYVDQGAWVPTVIDSQIN